MGATAVWLSLVTIVVVLTRKTLREAPRRRWHTGHTRERRRHASRKTAKGWRREGADAAAAAASGSAWVEATAAAGAGLVLGQHWVGVGLALCGVGRGDAVDDGLCLFVADLLVVVDDVAQVVPAAVMGLADAHRVVGEVNIAVVAEDCGRGGGGVSFLKLL